jgi:hypothetical protein
MREFSGSHHSDALYQGTTLVQSWRVTKDLGFQPGIPGLEGETWGTLRVFPTHSFRMRGTYLSSALDIVFFCQKPRNLRCRRCIIVREGSLRIEHDTDYLARARRF